ncbi:hypothetical protein CL684_01780 [Candidatus Campbellbacteria bacterium]|nr:hypothetical protein [Candidatus Campbellbacteria bacterium]|tara:strand:- start:2777 stop:3952 length:1176 start_codon:yes stop_codon:yes gene_type:complete
MKSKYIILIVLAVLLLGIGITLIQKNNGIEPLLFQPTSSEVPEINQQGERGSPENKERDIEPQSVISNLSIPWDMVFIGDDVLVTQRTGNVVRINLNSNKREVVYTSVSSSRGEGGLLGIVLHPAFDDNDLLYLYETYESSNGTRNKVTQYRYRNDSLQEQSVLIDNIPGAVYHDGGRMAFGPDDKLYVTTGDATNKDLAQNLNSLAGKILRLNDDGSIPSDNPFENSPIYSYGHRNPQGLAWDSNGNLWSTEHGPSGLSAGQDELNRIVAGGNYGWPYYSGTERPGPNQDAPAPNLRYPAIGSGPDEVWAPAGLAYHDGYLYFGGLRGEALYRAQVNNGTAINLRRLYAGDYGRLRFTQINNDMLYFSTSNTDGRGTPNSNDDKIFRLSL